MSRRWAASLHWNIIFSHIWIGLLYRIIYDRRHYIAYYMHILFSSPSFHLVLMRARHISENMLTDLYYIYEHICFPFRDIYHIIFMFESFLHIISSHWHNAVCTEVWAFHTYTLQGIYIEACFFIVTYIHISHIKNIICQSLIHDMTQYMFHDTYLYTPSLQLSPASYIFIEEYSFLFHYILLLFLFDT